jgi:hypothetical protein
MARGQVPPRKPVTLPRVFWKRKPEMDWPGGFSSVSGADEWSRAAQPLPWLPALRSQWRRQHLIVPFLNPVAFGFADTKGLVDFECGQLSLRVQCNFKSIWCGCPRLS